jgi:hypothetical protein
LAFRGRRRLHSPRWGPGLGSRHIRSYSGLGHCESLWITPQTFLRSIATAWIYGHLESGAVRAQEARLWIVLCTQA